MGNTGDNTSLLSYNSTRDIKQFVKEVNGRIFNNLADNYLLPSDEPEWVRLEKQSVALVIAMGGLYPCPDVIEAILDPADGQSKSILDVGCGTGSWAAEMARRFPHAFVLGVDVAPPPMDTSVFPPNLQFEIDDVNLGLSHFYDQYDVVHVRCVSGGIKDMDQTIVEYQRCLKPGGVLLIIEGDYNMYETKEKPARLKRLPGDPDVSGVCDDGSWLRRMVLEACVACGLAGSCVHRSSELIDLGLWDYPLMDPETARAGGLYLPIGPWAKGSSVVDTQMLQYGGALMRQSFLNIHRAYHAILLQHGMSRNVLNEWSRQIDQEITTPKKKLWVRFRFCWARRRASEGLPAPPLPKHPGRSSPPDTPPLTPRGSNSPPISPEVKDFCRPLGHRYPAIEIFTTAEEARREREKRELNVGELPELMVERTWRLMQQQTNQSQSTEATSTTSP
ncbi:S-adenosyl-L-methionine-dependent methyltransferase [Serendipita vermifera]|nr:S-adenosyl-L-methionine-dependent methyltransferase [Serendipita vermifera]